MRSAPARVVGVGDVAGPVNVDGAWDVGLVVLLAGGEVIGLLAPSAEVRLLYITPDIYDAHLLVIEMCGEPSVVTRGSCFSIFYSSRMSCSRA